MTGVQTCALPISLAASRPASYSSSVLFVVAAKQTSGEMTMLINRSVFEINLIICILQNSYRIS